MISKDFILAGKATFTVDTDEDHYTFHVAQKTFEDGRKFWFVYRNSKKGRYIGKLLPANGQVLLTNASKVDEQDYRLGVLRRVMARIWRNEPLPDHWDVFHQGKCGRCGKPLTTPESVERGIGPECHKKMNATWTWPQRGLDFMRKSEQELEAAAEKPTRPVVH
jgi:hypothetical protein